MILNIFTSYDKIVWNIVFGKKRGAFAMAIDLVENVLTLIAVIFGLLYCLFKYIKTPTRGWLYVSIFFMTHLLSDYYWTTYTLVMGTDPDVSAMMAYFGWNIGYPFLLLLALYMLPEETKGFTHPLMFLPIPLGVIQFFIYIQYGGIFNNIWEGFFATATSCVCLKVMLYYFKNKRSGMVFPWVHHAVFSYIFCEYGMWTASCYSWPSTALDPYYYFVFGEIISLVLLGKSVGRDYERRGFTLQEKGSEETRFSVLLQVTVTIIIFFGCAVGYYTGLGMKQALPANSSDPSIYTNIAITLFIISIVVVGLILMIILMTGIRYNDIGGGLPAEAAKKRGRFNFIFTVAITLCLMIISVVYTSRLFYRVSVTGVIEDGKTKVYSTAVELENYLAVARSILLVTADSVELMVDTNEPQEKIRNYIVDQTTYQKNQFDENFTGLYAYIDGEYMDGIGWVPPDDYVVEDRDWYKEAVRGNGEITLVSPYVDAQSKEVVITICKLLNDGGKSGDYNNRKVVALELIINHVQDITQEVSLGGKGYGMVVNNDGLIIAHHDSDLNGKNAEELYGDGFMDSIRGKESAIVETTLNGQAYTLFVDSVIDQWYAVIAVSDDQLYADTNRQLAVNIAVSLVIFLLISFFYYLGYKSEQINAEKMEDMRSAGLKKEYEAEVLKQKESAADEANKAKSRFLAQMSHEIRTPINAILGMNELILRKTDDEEILEYSENIDSAGNTLLALINTILDFSKIEDGKMDIIPANYGTSSFINDLVNSISQRADAKGLKLILDIDETLPRTMYGDDVRISQVIMNLLTNAVKYTEKGSITFTMKSVVKDASKIRLFVSVKDTGMGIRPEDMDKLSVSFERLDEKKNRTIEGTGLGMSIVTSLLAMMGSHINVESTYGLGSEFSFTIDQGIVDDTPIGDFVHNLERRSKKRSDDDLISAPGARVLVVDDNALNLKVAENLLKLCKINPDAVSSGEETLSMMSKHKYDIVFLDHMMPKMDGVETLHELKERGLIPPETMMIALTANAVMGAKEKYLNEGFDNYLSKPIEINELVSLLKAYLPESAYDKSPTERHVVMEFKPGGENESGINNYDEEKLKAAGIDVETGLLYCADSRDMYFEMLDDFSKGFDQRSADIREFYEKQDWPEYCILVHALKSNLKTLGINELSEKAFALEQASKEGDSEFILKNHDEAMEGYERIVKLIREAVE